MRYLDFLEKMKSVHFKALENIDVASSIYFSFYEITGNRKTCIASILRSMLYLFFIDVKYNVNQEGKIAFVYSNSYKKRQDYSESFLSLTKVFDSKIIFTPGKKFLYLKNVKFLPSFLSWFKNLRKEFNFKETLFYCSMILFGITNAMYIAEIIKRERSKCVIVFSDIHIIDSMLVQLCNRQGIITATLQHGNFELDEPFVLSKSKYFLAYGKYSKEKAESYGISEDKIKEAGMLKLIGKSIPKFMIRKGKIKKIGIILSGYALADDDARMINTVEKYCCNKHISIYIKLHPHYGQEKYCSVNWHKADKVYNDEITVDEFKNIVDLAIVLNSSVFMEYIISLFPTLIFADKKDNFLPKVSWCKFNDEKTLQMLIEKLETDINWFENNMLQLRSYFSSSDNITLSYKNIIYDISS